MKAILIDTCPVCHEGYFPGIREKGDPSIVCTGCAVRVKSITKQEWRRLQIYLTGTCVCECNYCGEVVYRHRNISKTFCDTCADDRMKDYQNEYHKDYIRKYRE